MTMSPARFSGLKLLLLSVVALLFPLLSASANDSLKQALFADCDAAMTQLSTVPSEDQLNTLEYIVDVLKLSTQVPDFPAAYWVQPGIPKPGEPAPSALWQAVDAKRELEAKRCALKLLEIAGAGAIRILPELVSIYSEENLGDEIAVGIEEAGVEIAEQAHRAGIALAGTELDQIIRTLASSRPLLAQNILIEYQSIALPRLLASLSQLSDNDRKKTLEFLHEIDPTSTLALAALKELAVKLNPDQLDLLARWLPLPRDSFAPKAVDDLAATATNDDPRIARSSIILMGRLCVELNGISLSSKSSSTFAGRPLVPLLSEGFIPLEEQKCLASSIKPLTPAVTAMLADSNPSVVLHALHLMPSVVRYLTGKVRNTTYARLKSLGAFDSTPTVTSDLRDAALLVMGAFGEHATETVTVYQEWIKKQPASEMPLGVVEGIRKLPESSSARFTPFLVSLLEQQIRVETVAKLLAERQMPLESELQRLIKLKADTEVRLLVRALSAQKTPRLSDIEVVATLVDSGSLGDDASQALIHIGKKATSPARERLATLPAPERPRALGVLVALGAALPAEADDLKRFLIQGTCSELARYRSAVERLLSLPQAATPDPLSIAPRVIACLPTLPSDLIDSLVKSPALGRNVSGDLVEQLLFEPASNEVLATFALSSVIEGGSPEPHQTELFQRILSTAPRLSKIVLLKQLLASGGSPLLTAGVRMIVDQSPKDLELFTTARCALARLGDSTYSWQPFVRETVEKLGQGIPADRDLEALQHLPVPLVLGQLTVAFRSGYIPITVGGARVASTMAKSADSLAPQLRELLRDRSPPIRYAAALALFHIDAASPVLLDPIRRVLVNRYFEPNKVKSPTAGQRELFTALIASRLGVLREKRLTQITGIAAAFQDLHPTVEPSPDAVAQRGPEGTASK